MSLPCNASIVLRTPFNYIELGLGWMDGWTLHASDLLMGLFRLFFFEPDVLVPGVLKAALAIVLCSSETEPVPMRQLRTAAEGLVWHELVFLFLFLCLSMSLPVDAAL